MRAVVAPGAARFLAELGRSRRSGSSSVHRSSSTRQIVGSSGMAEPVAAVEGVFILQPYHHLLLSG